HRSAQRLVANQQLQRFDELVAVGIPESAVAAAAVLDEDGASSVDEDRRSDRQGLEGEKRQALVRRRTDDDGGGYEGLEALSAGASPGGGSSSVPVAGMRGYGWLCGRSTPTLMTSSSSGRSANTACTNCRSLSVR